jgi:hypothetical protein
MCWCTPELCHDDVLLRLATPRTLRHVGSAMGQGIAWPRHTNGYWCVLSLPTLVNIGLSW